MFCSLLTLFVFARARVNPLPESRNTKQKLTTARDTANLLKRFGLTALSRGHCVWNISPGQLEHNCLPSWKAPDWLGRQCIRQRSVILFWRTKNNGIWEGRDNKKDLTKSRMMTYKWSIRAGIWLYEIKYKYIKTR